MRISFSPIVYTAQELWRDGRWKWREQKHIISCCIITSLALWKKLRPWKLWFEAPYVQHTATCGRHQFLASCQRLPLKITCSLMLCLQQHEHTIIKGNFVDIEIRKWIELYSQHKKTLTATQSSVMTSKKKQPSWSKDVKEDMSDWLHSANNVLKKWKNLLSKARFWFNACCWLGVRFMSGLVWC